jgi:hypothetical protein
MEEWKLEGKATTRQKGVGNSLRADIACLEISVYSSILKGIQAVLS